ncbi:hemerythrin domain-containing protein [Sphingomonas sp. 10B4]|uniref:hemerythrin domain-containing protein n=1 Tax=Sphingomonas sp. 10B4 TaxID=3048575 RepID=UPI002AB4DB32|nr:hemerythrin domain-containing protein [Sphingomonas sp. 10B4]MDY7524707.1 hemerythrin domain-containing protein [Sphingomonas sp. 10B4]MEB0282305.1 hemerythrin domain-containing protein [Sphingomonas sp. 10B4]
MDITQLILDEHGQQRALFAQIEQIDPTDTTALSALWNRLHALLDSHAEAEERFFYPRLMQIGEGGNDADSAAEETEDAIEDHNDIRDTAAAVDKEKVGSTAWFEALGECNKANSDHMAEEERQGLTDFRLNATLQERHDLGVKFATFEAEHLTGVKAVDKDPKTWVKDHAPD